MFDVCCEVLDLYMVLVLECYLIELVLVLCDFLCYDVGLGCCIVWGVSLCGFIVLECCVCVCVWLVGCDFVMFDDVCVVVVDVLCYCVLFSYEVIVEGWDGECLV